MAKVSGKGSIAGTLIANPAVRRVILRNAKRVAASAGGALAKRGVTVPTPGRSAFDTATVKSVVTSVAKPVAERLAKNETGRSVLQTISDISTDALGTKRKRPDGPLSSFVTKLAASGAAPKARAAQPEPPKAAFTPLRPPPPPAENAAAVVKWPPRKPPIAAGESGPTPQ